VSVRVLSLAGLLAACCLVSAPAVFAKGKTSPKPPPAPGAFFYHVYGLIPSHHYQLRVQSKGKVAFTGNAIEDLTYVKSGQLGATSKSLQYKGTTPKTYSLTQPITGRIESWTFTIQILTNKTLPLYVHVVDLSRHHS
jgi:hypothetical protein